MYRKHLEVVELREKAFAARERATFNVCLYRRMIGAAAEIDDHLNRGRNGYPDSQRAVLICGLAALWILLGLLQLSSAARLRTCR